MGHRGAGTMTWAHVLRQLITPHDEFQDGVLLFVFLVTCVNSYALAKHLFDHKRWREKETGRQRHTGSLH
jgi:hypothetical protein